MLAYQHSFFGLENTTITTRFAQILLIPIPILAILHDALAAALAAFVNNRLDDHVAEFTLVIMYFDTTTGFGPRLSK